MKKYIFTVLLVLVANYIVSNFFIELPYSNPAIQSFLNPLISKQYMFQQNELYSLKVFAVLSIVTTSALSMLYFYKEKYTL